MGGRFTFIKWNGKYSGDAKFIVRDNNSGKQSIFTPGRTQDLVWTGNHLDSSPDFKDWEDFGNESIDNLEEVAF